MIPFEKKVTQHLQTAFEMKLDADACRSIADETLQMIATQDSLRSTVNRIVDARSWRVVEVIMAQGEDDEDDAEDDIHPVLALFDRPEGPALLTAVSMAENGDYERHYDRRTVMHPFDCDGAGCGLPHCASCAESDYGYGSD